jgi:hypothetical protein
MVHQVPLHNKKLQRLTGHRNSLFIHLFILMVHQLPLHTKESQHQTGHFLFFIAHQVPPHNKLSQYQTGHRTYFILFFNLIYFCIRCRSTSRSRSKRQGAGLFF